jgi:hypothetical protein
MEIVTGKERRKRERGRTEKRTLKKEEARFFEASVDYTVLQQRSSINHYCHENLTLYTLVYS